MSRDIRELTDGEVLQFWGDVVFALVEALKRHRVCGSGAGYDLYTAIYEELRKAHSYDVMLGDLMRKVGNDD